MLSILIFFFLFKKNWYLLNLLNQLNKETNFKKIEKRNESQIDFVIHNNTHMALHLKNNLINKPTKIKMSFCQILIKPFCSRCVNNNIGIKYRLFNQAKSILKGYLDISNIIKKLEEYEKLKQQQNK